MSRILCLIDSLASGGAERQMTYLVTGLKNAGYDVCLMVFSEGKNFYLDELVTSGVDVVVNPKGLNKIKRVLIICKMIKKFEPDAVIAYKDGITMASCLARYLVKFKLIVSERNTTQELTYYERLKFLLYRKADTIVPNSFSQFRFISKTYPALANKLGVITNMVDTNKFQPCKRQFSNTLPIISITARVMAQKNVLTFLDAVYKIKQKRILVKFRWFGFQDQEYFKLVKNKLDDLQISDYVEFQPAVKNVQEVYQNSDFYCLPSLYEGFPNVICEAMSCGLPVLCSNVCDNPDIIEDGINGFLFDPKDSDDIALKIEHMLNQPKETLESMRLNNIQKIKNMCSIDSFLAKYIKIIKSDCDE